MAMIQHNLGHPARRREMALAYRAFAHVVPALAAACEREAGVCEQEAGT